MVIKSDKSLSPFAAPSETRSKLRQALPQILAVSVKNVLLLGFGMTLGFPTILIPSLSGNNPEEPIALGQEAISWIGSINLICVPVGCLLSGALTQPLGRKRAMQLVNIPFLTAWLLFYFSTEVWQIFLALAITGVTGGLLEAPTLTFVAEITQPSLRGILSATSGIAVILGILVEFLLGTFYPWRTVAIISCTTNILSFLLLFFLPESPYWLLLKGRQQDAQESLAWLRGWATIPDIQSEYTFIRDQIANVTQVKLNLPQKMQLFTKKYFFWPFSIISLAFFLAQFTGTTPLQIFAVKIFQSFHAPIDEYYATVALGCAELLGCVVNTSMVHYTGKRIMSFFSLLCCGLCFFIVAVYAKTLTYVAEITQPSLRGVLCSTSTVAIIAGILIQFLLGTFITWRQVALVSCTVPVLSFLTLFLVPESPYWLIAKKRFEDTRKSLAWLRGWLTLEEVDSEFQELSTQIQSREEHHTSWRLYTKKSFLWPYALVSFTFFLGHFSGMTTLQTYAIKIFSSINAPIDKYYATISLGAVEVLGCILSASLVHFLGKRIMNFFSLLACGTCFLIVATFAHLHGFLYLEENDGPSSWLPMCLLIATAFFTHSGIRILPWMLVGEVFSHQTRATATGIASGTSYIFSFAANKLFLGMVERLTLPGTFWMYGGLCVLGTVILYFALPETEGKTLFEITEHFAGNKHLDNKVWTKEEGAVVNRGYVHSTDGLNSESKF